MVEAGWHPDTPPTFDRRAALPTILGVAASVIAGRVLSGVVFDHFGHSVTAAVVALYLPLFGGLAATSTFVSKRFGSGRFSEDFGWRFRWGDLWRGLLVHVVSSVAATIVIISLRQDQVQERRSDSFRHGMDAMPVLAILTLTIAAVVLAPLFEELVFRGILLRSLTARIGVWWAVVAQGALFGAYHFVPDLGTVNVGYTIGLAVVGVVYGLAAAHWRRLGVSTVAHAISNAIFVIAVVTT